ncbi:high-affinity methionine permease [Clohesyomyces aquaticus]|uniref:High-affinity methionine permease n=1 Tax=Clohesyomyces aquaticus TaxID=1231657 RepID=A0A1Y1Y4L4_9PLEO|nr:high-affinity methionine permease [Clohesyomyces aquaticus]
MPSLSRLRLGNGSKYAEATTTSTVVHDADISNGRLKYVVEQGENDSPPSYQEAAGAPVEARSPFGYAVGPITIFINISKMIGTGAFSTPSAILSGTGSVGLSMIWGFLGYLIAISSLAVYLEYASYFPNRSGSKVTYLEQVYPRPKYFFPIAFAVQSVILSFKAGSANNDEVLAKYLFATNGHTLTNWEVKGAAIAAYTVTVLLLVFHTRFSYAFSNAVGIVKVLTLAFIAITGFVVLGGHTKVKDPEVNFRHSFTGKATAYGATNAMYKIIFSYARYENAFNLINEIKNPVKKLRFNSYLALTIVAILYVLANVAYFTAVPKAELKAAKEISVSLFFKHALGSGKAVRVLNLLIALSSFGNLIAVLIGQSRLIRECGRFQLQTKQLAVVDLQVYPRSIFGLSLAAGLFFIRRQRARLNFPRSEFRAWDGLIVFNIITNVFLLAMPWYPPPKGKYGGDVSFWYAIYVVVGITLLAVCGIYYVAWIYILPKSKGYCIRQEVIILEDDAQAHKLTKVPVEQLADWDATHDALGRNLNSHSESDSNVVVDSKEV